jgi:GT2 family glycosyltransferase
MKICLIIINYNGINFLKRFLREISNSCEKNQIDLIITDDQSSDESIKFLEKNNYIYTVNNSINRGFASNVNNGLKYAEMRSRYDYYLIANNDIEIGNGFFELALPKALVNLSGIDSQPKLIGFDEILEDRSQYFKNYKFETYDGTVSSPLSAIPGFFFLIERKLITEIGYLDEEYYMYGEDNDYFIRVLQGGFKIYNTLIPVRHYSEGSSTNDKKTSWYVYRNAFLFSQKNKDFFGIVRMFMVFVWKIYNPFYKSKGTSDTRIIRSGFMYNNYLLIKSIVWNIQYYLNKRKIHEK